MLSAIEIEASSEIAEERKIVLSAGTAHLFSDA